MSDIGLAGDGVRVKHFVEVGVGPQVSLDSVTGAATPNG